MNRQKIKRNAIILTFNRARVAKPSAIPGLRQPFTSAGPPGVTELMMVPRSMRPEFSPPTTWNPREHTQAQIKCTQMNIHTPTQTQGSRQCAKWIYFKIMQMCPYPGHISHLSSGWQLWFLSLEMVRHWAFSSVNLYTHTYTHKDTRHLLHLIKYECTALAFLKDALKFLYTQQESQTTRFHTELLLQNCMGLYCWLMGLKRRAKLGSKGRSWV